MSIFHNTAHPELVEGLYFSSQREGEGQGFDKLSLSGSGLNLLDVAGLCALQAQRQPANIR
jgi:hypothetical protein